MHMNTLPFEIQHHIYQFLNKYDQFLFCATFRIKLPCQPLSRHNLISHWIESGHLSCVQWFLLKYESVYCNLAARHGQLNSLRWLHQQGCIVNNYTIINAAYFGNLSCLQYAFEHSNDKSEDLCLYAAKGGDLACLQYLHEHGCKLDNDTCINAAIGGHLSCLKYLHDHGCSWNEGTTYNSARYGHLSCLQYAIENGCAYHLPGLMRFTREDISKYVQTLR